MLHHASTGRVRLTAHVRAVPLLVPLLAGLCTACTGDAPPPPSPRLVRTMRVSPPDATGDATDRYPGVVVARVEASVAFQVPGRITTRLAEVGTRVAPGTPLARLDVRDLALAVDAARASVRGATADAATAASDLARARELHAQRVVSDAALERAIEMEAAARARRDEAAARLAAAENGAAYATLRAPGTGIVTAVLAEAGQVVTPGEPVFLLARDGETEIGMDVPEDRRDALRVGMPAVVALVAAAPADEGREWRGRIREVAPAADPLTGTYRVRVALEAGARPPALGRSVSVRLPRAVRNGLHGIPSAALVRTGAAPGVWVLGPRRDRLQFRAVEIARVTDGQVVLRRGLAPGEEIVVAGANRLDSTIIVAPWEGTLP